MIFSDSQLKLPDTWQHESVSLLRNGVDVIVNAPTGAGKTYIFELLHQSRSLKGQAVYTVPTRALANDKYAEWKSLQWDVGIATGDVSENIHAPVLVATLETQLERLMRGEGPAILVIDEYQMLGDETRGIHYEGAIALAPLETRLLLLSGSVSNPEEIRDWMRRLGREAEVVSTLKRPVPLEESFYESLPQHQSRHFDSFWAKFAATVLLADLAPLLIFAPRRKDAEQIARRIAAELPLPDKLELTPEQRTCCGKELAQLIEKRIAFHHSGLSYAARAGVIEPLAKRGQLRVIVATMGLAAGINFSVRSVHVSNTTYHDGKGERKLEPDELLQMYGRAGRRGLDDIGYVVTTRQSSSLNDARPGRVTRSQLLSWPMFLRLMRVASSMNQCPYESALSFAKKLFAKHPPLLGIEPNTTQELKNQAFHQAFEQTEPRALFGIQAQQLQFLNSQGEWEQRSTLKPHWKPLLNVWALRPDQVYRPALSLATFLEPLSKDHGAVCKLAPCATLNKVYGIEIIIGKFHADSPSQAAIDSALIDLRRSYSRILSPKKKRAHFTLAELRKHLYPQLEKQIFITQKTIPLRGSTIYNERLRHDGTLCLQFDLRTLETLAVEDQHHRQLINPPEKNVLPVEDITIQIDSTLNFHKPHPHSVIHTWRKLKLIHPDGTPTQRGEITSFFHAGEGLAIAAALEDPSYPTDQLVLDLANLRAGDKFQLHFSAESERLSSQCRATYGLVNYEGYLTNGLPPEYGEGAADLIHKLIDLSQQKNPLLEQGIASGDLSRAFIEWISLIRHISHAPDHPWIRWKELKEAANQALELHSKTLRHLFQLKTPPLTHRQQTQKVRHILFRPY